MGNKGKRNPDHFQVCPKAVCDQSIYRRSLQRMRFDEREPVPSPFAAKEAGLRAGASAAPALRCAHCSALLEVSGTEPAGRCPVCGSNAYRMA